MRTYQLGDVATGATQPLDSAFVTFAMSAKGESIELELRYRLVSVNEPVSLPSPRG
jgi:hypothetical protein